VLEKTGFLTCVLDAREGGNLALDVRPLSNCNGNPLGTGRVPHVRTSVHGLKTTGRSPFNALCHVGAKGVLAKASNQECTFAEC
jgi:hypothetical protein